MISEHLPSLGQLVSVLIAGWSTLLVTIAALWATNPRASWLSRLAPIGLLLAVLMPMGLAGFAIMFVCQAVIVFGVLVVSRVIRRPGIDQPTQAGDTVVREVGRAAGPYRWLQFSLGRLFASIFVGTTILALVLSAPDEDDVVDFSDFADWLQLGLLGFALAAAALLAWMLVARGRWRAVAMAVAGLFLAAFVGQKSGLATSLATRFEITDLWLLASVWIVSLSLVLSCCLWLLAKAGWNWWPGRTAATRPPSKLARVTIVLIAVAFTLPTLDLGWAMVPPTRPTELQSPQPNGYEQLVHIEGQMSWGPVFDIDPEDATPSQSQQFVRDNQDRIVALEAALDLPSQATVYWEDTWPVQGRTFRNLYHAWDVAARAAIAQGDNGRAAECYLGALRMGNTCANGGTGLDELIANSIEGLAASRLAEDLHVLTDVQLSHVQQIADQCLRRREPIETLSERSTRHELVTGGWSGRLSAWFKKRGLSPGFDAEVELPNHRARRDARLNLLIVECALRRYYFQHGIYPQKLAELAPVFLKKLPQDPFGDEPFCYRRTDTGYLLYSINANRVDDGGISVENRLYEGDLMLP